MKFIILVLSILLTNLSMAAVIFDFDALGNGRIKVVIQGISGGDFQVNFYKKHKNDSDKGDYIEQKKSNSGGLSHVINATFSRDEQVTVSILNFNGNGQHLSQTSRTYGNLSGQNPNPTPTYTPTYQPTPQIPNSKIREYADQQARTVANRIAKTYGARENFRYNFVLGLWRGYDQYRLYNNNSQYGYGEYQRGYRQGINEGDLNGAAAGSNDASESGQSSGASDARSRFVRALDDQAPLDINLGQVTPPYYSGATVSGGYQQPSLNQKINELENDFRIRVCGPYRYDFDGYVLGCDWTLADAYRSNGTYSFIDSWFRADYAYSEWRNNGLGGRYDYNIYNQLNADQREIFVRYFKSTYEQVIDEKFNRIKFQPNYSVQELGFSYGIMLGKEMAHQQGLYDGYRHTFVPSSIRTFNLHYVNEYTSGFNKRVQYHSSRPVLESFQGQLAGNFIPNGKIDLIISRIVNLGLVDAANENIQVGGASITAQPISQTITIPALTTFKRPVSLKNVAIINYNVPTNTLQNVGIKIGSLSQTLSFEVSWNKILANFISLNSSDPYFNQSLAYIHKQIEEELKAARSSKNNIYEAGMQSNTLLTKTIEQYQLASTQGRQNLQKLAGFTQTGTTLCDIASDVTWNQFTLKKIKKSFIALYKSIDNSCSY